MIEISQHSMPPEDTTRPWVSGDKPRTGGFGVISSIKTSETVSLTSSLTNLHVKDEVVAQEKPQVKEQNSSSKNYEYFLRVAKEKNFDELESLKIIYQPGNDYAGRPIIVIIGNFPKHIQTDDIFLYFILLMDAIVENDYTLIYIHQSNARTPSIGWLRKVYGIFTRKYKKNLKQLFIVNPNFWIRAACRIFKPFISSKFWQKLVFLDDVHKLYKYISPHQLKLPSEVLLKDKADNVNRLFGASIDDVMKLPMNEGLEVPYIVENAIEAILADGLETVGLFRLSGNTKRTEELKALFDKGVKVDLREEPEIHVTCSLLKCYIRELPNPLIPYEMYDIVIDSYDDQNAEKTKNELMKCMAFVPRTSIILMKKLFELLNEIVKRSEVNKMTASNLAIVFGPNLLRSKEESPQLFLKHANVIPAIVKYLVESPDEIFSIASKKHGL